MVNVNWTEMHSGPTGWAKKVGHYVWRLTSSAYIFQMPERISVIDYWHTSTLFYSEYIRLFHIPQIHHRKWCHLPRGVQHNLFSRTSLDKLLNEIDCSNVLKDGKIEGVHNLLDQQLALCLLTIWSADCTMAWQSLTSVKHPAMNGDVISRMHFLSKQGTNETDLWMIQRCS